MAMITSIRAPLPVAEAPLHPPAPTRADRSAPVDGTAAVAPPQRVGSVTQAPAERGTDPQLLLSRASAEATAAAAAEAARDAYIKASIAAGISPLPLP
ncbi:hypothetical protein [Tabrizicola flagellatus]|uniref:hypothetical protein n=1 Tax=Tabrizicola flagellatus TaxID=2593021 RepID=UPI0011F2A022|nr:hypothetical protein [Tabrizicola flagellatus]